MTKKYIHFLSLVLVTFFGLTGVYMYATRSQLPSFGQMKLYILFEKYFDIDPVTTEKKAFELLAAQPLSRELSYIAVPWALLINSNNLDKVPNITVTDGVTVCQHIQFEKIIPWCKKNGVTTLFTPHVEKNKRYEGITVLPFPHEAVNAISPAATKDLLYSFIGSNTHWSRTKLFQMKHPRRTSIKERGIWHFASRNKEEEKQEYQNVLARSVFSICPRGTGPSTIRFWESLKAAAIPVMLGDDMVLPPEFDWSSCMVVVPYDQIAQLSGILSSISHEKIKKMQEGCLRAYTQFQGTNLVSTIRHYFR